VTSLPHEIRAPAPATGVTLLRLEGRDALGLLHRVSTQALEDLEPGRTRVTLFCDFRARLLHRVAVAVLADRSVWLVRDDAPAAELIEHLDRHVFREDVRIADAGKGLRVRRVKAASEIAPGTLREAGGVPSFLGLDAEVGFAIEPGEPRAPSAEEESARIASGWPRHGHEIHPDFNPFELGLAHEVHLSKGCFTGQEVLMRLVTYRGAKRRRVRIEGGGTPPITPSAMRLGSGVVGTLTSVAPAGDGWIGLAVLRNEVSDASGIELEADAAIRAFHVFPETRPLGLP
jgi:folate-binding protein YgfZ